ncbi:hypothetical protein ACFV98_14140 [Streptomyces violascens]|uniref:hypothetical protein n=1 Tax=Streptomyces violascens TaxID=67381 RepID=UPI003647AF1B
MNDQQAIARAEEILHQAVDGMSPKPTLKVVRRASVGPCLAHDDHQQDDRVQVRLGYQLADVPGKEAKNLVKQASEAWKKQGYGFQSPGSERDWSDPFPSVFMRSAADDFWMDATTGVLDRAKGEGLAAITVTSPCFTASGEAAAHTASPVGYRAASTDPVAERRILAHSSRIYDALRVPPSGMSEGEGLWTVEEDGGGVSLHHAWSTRASGHQEAVQAVGRGQAYFEGAGWLVRRSGPGALAGLNREDHSVAQISADESGSIRVAVTTPAVRVLRTQA